MNNEEIQPMPSESNTKTIEIGPTTEGLGSYLVENNKLDNNEAFNRVRDDAVAIVQRCHPFRGEDGTRTGLIVGYVQSGKTMSMVTVSALARDNGCRIIILFAGVTKNLLRQTAARFKKQLREASENASSWKIMNSEDGIRVATDVAQLRQAVQEWRDPDFEEKDQQTLLLVVLKNYSHLRRLAELLGEVNKSVDLCGIPALIFDDEADQAGLNTQPEEDPSTTNRWINRVRAHLPHHTYLQYTATPQAPLLISLDDSLSPAFAELVSPGDGYTGGETFFGRGQHLHRVRPVPPEDLFKPGAPPDSPPSSLIQALRVFAVGCAVARTRGGPRPRSMLVHPSQRKADHAQYVEWILQIQKRWVRALADPEDGVEDASEEFRSAYDDLTSTDVDLPPFEGLRKGIRLSVGRMVVKQVNSEDGSEIDWDNADEFVLVGGEKLNRGYTVEGLTVTYMPRDAGGWNADTLQQRARFFGYKRPYLGLVRVYLHPNVLSAFRNYVEHEESVRKQLAQHRGRPLREWRRAFFLDSRLRPTRRNVLSDPFFRRKASHVWFRSGHPHRVHSNARTKNNERIVAACAKWQFQEPDEPQWKQHKVARVPLSDVFEQLLLEHAVAGPDVSTWYGDLVQLSELAESDPEMSVLVVRMSDYHPRKRTPSDIDVINPFQGRSSGYPGDDKVREADTVTVQLHRLQVPGVSGPVPALAVHIPSSLRVDTLVQLQGGSP